MEEIPLFRLLERLTNLLRTETRRAAEAEELQAVQLQALIYLSHCNRYSDTPAAVTEYLGLTKGTVSQSLLHLERKGFLQKHSDEQDRRQVHLKLTAAAKLILKRVDPPPLLRQAEQDLDAGESATLRQQLLSLLKAMQEGNQYKTFGQCRSCPYLHKENKRFRCGLTNEGLKQSDTRLLCREHEFPLAAVKDKAR